MTSVAKQQCRRSPHKSVSDSIQKHYINRREAATYLGCSIKHLLALVKDGRIPEYDFGPFMKRYTCEDLDAFAQPLKKSKIPAAR